MITCPNCNNQVQNEEIQCPFCLAVLKQLSCGNCNNLLDLRYSQCVYCGQPYILPYQRQVKDQSQQHSPDLKEQRYVNPPVSQFSMQTKNLQNGESSTKNWTKKRKGRKNYEVEHLGEKLLLGSLRPIRNSMHTARNYSRLPMKIIVSMLALVLLIVAAFLVKDANGNTSADNRSLSIDIVESSNSNIEPIKSPATKASSVDNTQRQSTTDKELDDNLCWSCKEAPKSGSSVYCTSCKCLVCNLRRTPGSIYCASHTCNATSCNDMTVQNSQYCVSHKCIKSGCNNVKQHNSEYCYFHRNK